MKISIVAPNLNEGRFLFTFLESLVRQTFRNFEVIVIDGGSTDASLALLQHYAGQLRMQVLVDKTRNIGYVRNVGSRLAQGDLIFNTSSDTYFPPDLLLHVSRFFWQPERGWPGILAVSGRTWPLSSGLISVLAYTAFDLIRYLFTVAPWPLHKFRPAGNFTCIRNDVFRALEGFPEVKINEDGLMGQRIDDYAHAHGGRTFYDLQLFVGHHAKRFQKKGGLRAMAMYVYVFANMLPFLKPLFRHIERKSGEVFATRSDIGGS